MKKVRRAAALRYDRKTDRAPVLVAAGEGLIGEQIEKIARENQVPVVQDHSLAEALVQLDVGREIPPHLYQVVAEVLVYVMKVDGRYRKG
ncbi:flagellar biosynthesis [Candidatus Formimonas warabiya]|uniref:Flagellar biosynthesis n=2 Tax=Formimonas warabiya TaxID=1761012 RepID=A0A3G1L181_FORW1|nr:flagellar biosynthesis [Candidatus Formimonas warabiya]